MNDGPACAHKCVDHEPIEFKPGYFQDRWVCKQCGCGFVPSSVAQRLRDEIEILRLMCDPAPEPEHTYALKLIAKTTGKNRAERMMQIANKALEKEADNAEG